jgi:16S rRNA U516 pseudouridylate synthase RsuA-like enzyme
MTNDGELTQQLSHPSFEHEKEYEVTVDLSRKSVKKISTRIPTQVAS